MSRRTDSLRVLLVSDVPLRPGLGAARSAFGLEEGFLELGHHVVTWCSLATGGGPHEDNRTVSQRSRLEAYLGAHPRFDIVDSPPSLITDAVAKTGLAVARSIQPELDYWRLATRDAIRHHPLGRSSWSQLIRLPGVRRHLHEGWRNAGRILCLGSLGFQAMEKRFPARRGEIGMYQNALSSEDRRELRSVRMGRGKPLLGNRLRLIWIGRWVAHKGTDLLVDWACEVLGGRDGVTLTIAGCGEKAEREVRTRLAAVRGLEVLPAFERSELGPLLERHDAGLFTSISEGWGIGLQEMLESGLPVYATEAGAVPDLATRLGGLLRPFPPRLPITAAAMPSESQWQAYENWCNWPRIVERYIEFVLPALRGEVGERS